MTKVPSPAGAPKRSWLELTVDELANIANTGKVPDGLDWDTLPDHPAFERIFRARGNPAKVAQILLEVRAPRQRAVKKEAPVVAAPAMQPSPPSPPLPSAPPAPRSTQYIPALSKEYREERLKIKREELELQKGKQKNATLLFEKVCQLETDVKTIKRMIKVLIDLLREMDGRARKSGG